MDNASMTKTILDMASTLGKIEGTTTATKEKVDAHDELLKDHTKKLDDINQRTYHLDSWKNGIIGIVTEEKEKALATIRGEIKPMQDDLKSRLGSKDEIKRRGKDLTWDILKTGTLLFIGYMATKFKTLGLLFISLFR